MEWPSYNYLRKANDLRSDHEVQTTVSIGIDVNILNPNHPKCEISWISCLVSRIASLTDTPGSSSRSRCKVHIKCLRLKKNPDEKKYFFTKNFHFEKKILFFSSKILRWKIFFNFQDFFSTSGFWKKIMIYFFQNEKFSWKNIFFRPDFF